MKNIKSFSGGMPWLVAMGLTGLVAACGGGGGGGQDPILGAGDISPVIAPTVTVVSPLPNATGVALNTRVLTASFSQPMDVSSLTAASFSVACAAEPTITGGVVTPLAQNKTFLLTLPANSLPANAACVATVTTAAKNSSGLALANDFKWQFNTSAVEDKTNPTVTYTINADGATNIAVNTRVGATFSEALDPQTVTNATFTLKQNSNGAAVTGTTSYSGVDAVFIPLVSLLPNTQYTATVKGGATGIEDLANNAMAVDYSWSWTTAAVADTTAPFVTLVKPAELATNVPVTSAVNVTFNEAMDPLTITTANFKVAGVTGVVTFNALTKVATLTPNTALTTGTTYTATVTRGALDLAGNALTADKVWTFSTADTPVVPQAIPLNSATPFGTFGGTAGMTNMGTLTTINGDIGTTATGTSMVTGFHDTSGDIYTETPSNKGSVNGNIYTCTTSSTGPTSAAVNAPDCQIATQARLDAQTAYLALAATPVGGDSPAPGANLASLTLLPGTYKSAAGSFMIQGGDLTLDAQGDANATWVFQMATTLTVGGPGAAFPQSIILAGGAQAKNVFWQVGSFATINAAGGGTMVGTIIAQEGAAFSTAGNVNRVTLNGRVLSLGASVTLVNTVINVPQ